MAVLSTFALVKLLVQSDFSRMSYDLGIYAGKLTTDPIPSWMRRLNSYDRMGFEIHPAVKFEFGLSGFCPIKVCVPGRWPFSSTQDYISGFEMYVQHFDFESYFDLKNEDAETKLGQLRAEGLNLELWESFKLNILISFSANSKFEARLAFLSAAFLTEELRGICVDPQSGETLDQRNVFSWATQRVRQHESSVKDQNLISHPFDGWR